MALLLFKAIQGCTPCESSCARVWIWIRFQIWSFEFKAWNILKHKKKDPFWSDNPGLQVFLGCCISLKVLKGVNSQDTVAVTAWASCVIARVGCWKTHFSSWFSFSRRTSDCLFKSHIFFWIRGVVWGNFWPVWLPPMLGAWCAQTVAWRCPRLPRPWACWPTWQMPCEVYCRELGLTVCKDMYNAKGEGFFIFRVWNSPLIVVLNP